MPSYIHSLLLLHSRAAPLTLPKSSENRSSPPSMAERVHPLDPPSFTFTPLPRQTSETPSDDTSPFLSRSPTPTIHPSDTYVIQIPKEQILREPPPENAHRAKVFARRPRRRQLIRRCFCCSIASLLCLILAVGAFIGILFLVLHPKAPSYGLTSVSFAGMDPVLTSAYASLSPRIDTVIETNNTNKKISIIYQEGGTVSLSFQDTELCSGEWPSFRSKPKTSAEFKVELSGSGILLTSTTRDALVNDHSKKEVPLVMEAKVPVKIKLGAFTSWKITVKVKCDITVGGITGDPNILKKDCTAKSHFFW
ncbi:hypothetical protein LUZ60_015509 [Juncus effusus]|nr:hypothetical protein LUZ60_015509 [Juncus effusus]